jgi:glycosyltransferase involved in cell wall biosynthesis
MRSAKLTVIVPFRDRGYELDRALSSVEVDVGAGLARVVLVNDRSKKHALDVAENWRKKYPKNIEILDNQFSPGPGGARNTALKYSTTKYVCFLDSDDTFSHGALSIMVARAETERCDVVVPRLVSKPDSRRWIWDTSESEIDIKAADLSERPQLIHSAGPGGKLFLSSFLRERNLLFGDGIFTEDIPFTVPALLLATRLCVEQSALYNYYSDATLGSERQAQFTSSKHYDDFISALRITISKLETVLDNPDKRVILGRFVFRSLQPGLTNINHTLRATEARTWITQLSELASLFPYPESTLDTVQNLDIQLKLYALWSRNTKNFAKPFSMVKNLDVSNSNVTATLKSRFEPVPNSSIEVRSEERVLTIFLRISIPGVPQIKLFGLLGYRVRIRSNQYRYDLKLKRIPFRPGTLRARVKAPERYHRDILRALQVGISTSKSSWLYRNLPKKYLEDFRLGS